MALINDFVDKLETGVGMKSGEPAYAYRERILSVGKGAALNHLVRMALLIKAFNAHVQGKSIKVLRWGDEEDFPTVLGE